MNNEMTSLTKLAFFGRLLGVALASLVIGQVYLAIVPTRPEYTDRQLRLVDELSTKVAAWISSLEAHRDTAAFGNLDRDSFGAVSLPIRNAVWQTDRFDLLDRRFMDKLRERALWTLPTHEPEQTLGEMASEREAAYAIGGRVERFTDDGSSAALIVTLVVRDVDGRHILDEQTFELRDEPFLGALALPAAAIETVERMPLTYRFLVWMAIFAALPFALLIQRTILTEGGNVVVLTALAVLVTVATITAHFLVGDSLSPFWAGALLLAVLPLSAFYNVRILTYLKENWA
jgi:hypothetical protein